jgi:hypothetical protein
VLLKLDAELEAQLKVWEEVLAKDLPALNEAIEKHGVAFVAVTPAKTD